MASLKGLEKGEDEIERSIKSEFNYSEKKKFTELVAQPNRAHQLARLQQDYQANDKAQASLKSQSMKSKLTQKTNNSRAAQAVIEKHKGEADVPGYSNKLVEELVGTL